MTTPTDGPNPQTDNEKSVQFINAEVLDPPKQGSISFVKPFYEQTLVMALEDARSFVQGAEQILLVALAKALEKAISGGAGAPEVNISSLPMADDLATGSVLQNSSQPQSQQIPPSATVNDTALKSIESVMASLASFHSTIVETTHKYKGDN
ncbi:MAG: hypothetical protein V3V13_01305 [Paracoccaceae bacterium]